METAVWMHVSEIVEDRVNVKILPNGKKAIVLRKGDVVRVFAEVCPHLGADLAEASYCASARTLQCKWHGYLFSTEDGRFVDNPNERMMQELREPTDTYQPHKTPKYRLGVIQHRVADGRVYFPIEERS